jgi:hypothetical protein
MALTISTVGAAEASGVVVVTNPAPAANTVTESGGHTLFAMSATAGGTAGFLIAIDANAVPTSGAALVGIHQVQAVAAGATENITLGVPDDFVAGVALLFSSSTTTYTPVVAAWIGGQAQ